MRILILFIAIFFVGCSSIQSYSELQQPTARILDTYVGGVVFKVTRSSDLPNAVGKADIWGGKVNRGFLELRYQGVREDGLLVFYLKDIETLSNETTMSRYGASSYTTVNATSYGNSVYATATTYERPDGQTVTLPPYTTYFLIDPESQSVFEIGDVSVSVIDATNTKLTYSLNKHTLRGQ